MTKVSDRGEDIGTLLGRWQRRESLTDEEIAARLGVSRQMLHHWRVGTSAPNRNRWPLIAERTGKTIEQVAVAVAQGVKP